MTMMMIVMLIDNKMYLSFLCTKVSDYNIVKKRKMNKKRKNKKRKYFKCNYSLLIEKKNTNKEICFIFFKIRNLKKYLFLLLMENTEFLCVK